MAAFTVGGEQVNLPAGAFAHSRRQDVCWQGRHVFSCSQGPWRACLYPVYSPAGAAVTSESPVDHPHHNSIWIASDRVTALLPFEGGEPEAAVYNFYVNDTFQGRAPGRIVSLGLQSEEVDANHLVLRQQLAWRGPREWGASDGRVIALEQRVLHVRCSAEAYVIDMVSNLTPTEWELHVGPTRHAYHGVRVVESLRQSHGGQVTDSAGVSGAAAIDGTISDWVDMSGPVGAGHRAGIALMPHADSAGHPWFVTDWGTMTVNPFVAAGCTINLGGQLQSGVRIVIHDGLANSVQLAALHTAIESDMGNT